MKKILFVCTGNTCRSPMAEYIMNKLIRDNGMQDLYTSSSAGVSTVDGLGASGGSIYACSLMGIDLSEHRSTMVNEYILRDADIILTMSSSHKAVIESYFPEESNGKLYTLGEFASICDSDTVPENVSDPYMMSDEVYVRVCKQITSYLEIIIKYLKGITERK